MSNKLEYLFNLIKDFAYENKIDFEYSFNDKNFINTLGKEINLNLDIYNGWKKISKTLINDILSLPEFTIDGFGNKNLISSNHYLIEQVRIPYKNKAKLNEIIKIAINIGKFLASENKELYDKVSYILLKLENLKRYIYISDMEKLSKKISNEQLSSIKKLCGNAA